MKKLEGKVCAITGGADGIGAAAVEIFAGAGGIVWILDINASQGESLAAKLKSRGMNVHFIETNVASNEAVQAAFATIQAESGRLNVLYNNASIYLNREDGIITRIASETWHKVLSVNLDSIFFCSKCAIPLIIQAGGGSIINTASSAGVVGIPRCDAYTASKGATVALTRSMASEYGKYNIRVNCIAPAAIASRMSEKSNPDDEYFDPDYFIRIRSSLRRWGTPGDVARTALFLAGDDSSYLTGCIIPVDGGVTSNGDLAKTTCED